MRSEGYCSWVRLCVCLSVCLSAQHLTSRAFFRPEIDITYSTGNEGQKICGVFSETASLQRSSTPSVVRPYVQAAIFHARALYLWACAYPAHTRILIIRTYQLTHHARAQRVCTLVLSIVTVIWHLSPSWCGLHHYHSDDGTSLMCQLIITDDGMLWQSNVLSSSILNSNPWLCKGGTTTIFCMEYDYSASQ